MRIKISGLVILGCLVFASEGWGWQLKKNTSGIKVYTRAVKGSKFKEYKAVMIMKASADVVAAILTDTRQARKWIDRLKISKVLKKINTSETITYTLADAPWPVKDRETISRSKVTRSADGSLHYTSFALPKYLPPNDEYVRVEKLKAIWKIDVIGGGRVKVTNIVHAEAGGSVPGWMANMFIVDIPFKTMNKLRRRVKSAIQ